MATTAAAAAVCDALIHILTTAGAADRDDLGFGDLELTFRVYGAGDFVAADGSSGIATGASVFLYRALPNLTHRTPAGQLGRDGRRRRTRLPLDLHLLVTIWGSTADTQNRLLGWVMRTLEDYPTLPDTVLNVTNPGTFDPGESVEIVLCEMPNEELLHLWEVLGNGEIRMQPCIPYVARAVFIDSQRDQHAGEPVQVRTLQVSRMAVGE